jgi:hypothetical protein
VQSFLDKYQVISVTSSLCVVVQHEGLSRVSEIEIVSKIKKWIIFVAQKKRRAKFVTAIFLFFVQFVRHPLVELF